MKLKAHLDGSLAAAYPQQEEPGAHSPVTIIKLSTRRKVTVAIVIDEWGRLRSYPAAYVVVDRDPGIPNQLWTVDIFGTAGKKEVYLMRVFAQDNIPTEFPWGHEVVGYDKFHVRVSKGSIVRDHDLSGRPKGIITTPYSYELLEVRP